MIVTVTFHPAVDKTTEVDRLQCGGLNRLHHVIVDAGGKGINVSKTLQALGASSICSGFLAGASGAFIQKSLQKMQIKCDFVWVDGATRTNLKVLDSSMEVTELNEIGSKISTQDRKRLVDKIMAYTSSTTIVVLSGSVPKGVSDTIYKDMIHAIKKANGRVILDADGSLFANGLQAKPTVIKPNKYELLAYFHASQSTSDTKLLQCAQTLVNEDTKIVIISMGKEGAYFLTKDTIFRAKGLAIRAHSSVGAGDAMVAGVAYAMEQNYDMEQCIRLAMACSAGAVMSKGTKPATKEVVEKLMKQVTITNEKGGSL